MFAHLQETDFNLFFFLNNHRLLKKWFIDDKVWLEFTKDGA